MSNTESISARLRRWSNKDECLLPLETARDEYGIDESEGWRDLREVFINIADEIDREMDELRESFANPSYVNIEDAVREVALGIDEHGRTKDAIERWYNPKPIDENNEPIDLGQTVDDKARGDLEVSRVCYTQSGFYFNESHGTGKRRKKMKGITYKYGERVKCPKQQVLDADGVECCIGETVYRIDKVTGTSNNPLVIDKVTHDGTLWWKGGGCAPARLFTHRKPTVLDADGVPIEVGDEIWNIKTGARYIVEKMGSDGCYDCHEMVIRNESGLTLRAMGKFYTHREPDTQERIDKDAVKSVCSYFGFRAKPCSECPAYGSEIGCSNEKVRDLLRRQRELDGRDA